MCHPPPSTCLVDRVWYAALAGGWRASRVAIGGRARRTGPVRHLVQVAPQRTDQQARDARPEGGQLGTELEEVRVHDTGVPEIVVGLVARVLVALQALHEGVEQARRPAASHALLLCARFRHERQEHVRARPDVQALAVGEHESQGVRPQRVLVAGRERAGGEAEARLGEEHAELRRVARRVVAEHRGAELGRRVVAHELQGLVREAVLAQRLAVGVHGHWRQRDTHERRGQVLDEAEKQIELNLVEGRAEFRAREQVGDALRAEQVLDQRAILEAGERREVGPELRAVVVAAEARAQVHHELEGVGAERALDQVVELRVAPGEVGWVHGRLAREPLREAHAHEVAHRLALRHGLGPGGFDESASLEFSI
mmetsp:Transcript_35662/g.83786  ORF Transcript_35662/g.83786 Transcript_35662/m.83786 type:complete len:370 (-) Transcript_35662:10-1119(-)